MRYGELKRKRNKLYLEIFPETPRDIALLGGFPSECKTYEHSTHLNSPRTSQTPILVEADEWGKYEFKSLKELENDS